MALDPTAGWLVMVQSNNTMLIGNSDESRHGNKIGMESKKVDSAKQHLRHVEKDVLIPKIMREKARERCSEQVEDFTKCCKDSGILMVVKCRKENSALKECLTAYYNDPTFYEECKMEYLKEREEFRKTGIPTKKRLQKLPTSM
ncbi:COX assembly mitochondrial protein homolog isoform X1 [Balaenoptera musculus]|uniref:COX assembly mitochondrial protein n=3 Tax=Balaenoptera TaxID=9766 RepID=A0A8B8YUY3_BALMU|nr:COX assembly mitochondrial protein homolog isoform X1 [Balaenoptera musculus]